MRPVAWQADGAPRSMHFDGIYRSSGQDGQGGLALARDVFLAGCGLLPDTDQELPRWSHRPDWHILETGFGLGLNFLATWEAWRQDPNRPDRLFFTSVEARPVEADDIIRSVAGYPGLKSLASSLAQEWKGLLPGVHRLEFEQGRIVLTLHIGAAKDMLTGMDALVDSIFLGGFNPSLNPEMWQLPLLKAIARLAHRDTRLAAGTVTPQVLENLTTAGFLVEKGPGSVPNHEGLRARFAPRWTVKSQGRERPTDIERRALVIGTGLAGSAVAWSLAERGWQVEVVDGADHVAAGASALPAGLVAPHVSPDDAPLSRVTRAGVRATLARAQRLLKADEEWALSGVLEHRVEGKHKLPSTEAWQQYGRLWSRPALTHELVQAGLDEHSPALWHGLAGWLRPACLVEAQLQHPNIRVRLGMPVKAIEPDGDGWRARFADASCTETFPTLILATAFNTRKLIEDQHQPAPPLNALRGQISSGLLADLPSHIQKALPPFPVNGHGSFIHGRFGQNDTPSWVCGSTFDRGVTEALLKPEDHLANQDKLNRLLPSLGALMTQAFDNAQGWAAIRCTLPDRLPAFGPLKGVKGLHVCAGMGARGLTLSVLCGELLAATIHGEPWPMETRLSLAMMASRF